MPNLCHLPKLLDMHQWWKYANIYATYELTGINNVTRSPVIDNNDANTNYDADANNNDENFAWLH